MPHLAQHLGRYFCAARATTLFTFASMYGFTITSTNPTLRSLRGKRANMTVTESESSPQGVTVKDHNTGTDRNNGRLRTRRSRTPRSSKPLTSLPRKSPAPSHPHSLQTVPQSPRSTWSALPHSHHAHHTHRNTAHKHVRTLRSPHRGRTHRIGGPGPGRDARRRLATEHRPPGGGTPPRHSTSCGFATRTLQHRKRDGHTHGHTHTHTHTHTHSLAHTRTHWHTHTHTQWKHGPPVSAHVSTIVLSMGSGSKNNTLTSVLSCLTRGEVRRRLPRVMSLAPDTKR